MMTNSRARSSTPVAAPGARVAAAAGAEAHFGWLISDRLLVWSFSTVLAIIIVFLHQPSTVSGFYVPNKHASTPFHSLNARASGEGTDGKKATASRELAREHPSATPCRRKRRADTARSKRRESTRRSRSGSGSSAISAG